jgi:hypothetical protein
LDEVFLFADRRVGNLAYLNWLDRHSRGLKVDLRDGNLVAVRDHRSDLTLAIPSLTEPHPCPRVRLYDREIAGGINHWSNFFCSDTFTTTDHSIGVSQLIDSLFHFEHLVDGSLELVPLLKFFEEIL